MKDILIKVESSHDTDKYYNNLRLRVKDCEYSEALVNSLVKMRFEFSNNILGNAYRIKVIVKSKKEVILKRCYFSYGLYPVNPNKPLDCINLFRIFFYYRCDGYIYVNCKGCDSVFIYKYDENDGEYYRVFTKRGERRFFDIELNRLEYRHISCSFKDVFIDAYQELYDQEKILDYSH